MDAKELRIGNLVKYNNYIIATVHGITDANFGHGISIHYENTCLGCGEDLIDPLELTKERLLKAGFEEEEKDMFIQKEYINNAKIRINFSKEQGFQWLPNFWVRVNLPYVHTLQNLFFVLNNTELAIQND